MTDITIQKGATFTRVLRWESLPWIYTAITAITKAAPMLVTSPSHSLADGWRAAVVSALGMRQANAKRLPPRPGELKPITRISASQVAFNTVDSSRYTTYTSGGFLASYTPVDISGYTARMMVRPTAEDTGTPLISLVSPTDIALDNTQHTITITIAASVTAALTFETGVYDLELVSGAGVVTRLVEGNVFVSDEVTR